MKERTTAGAGHKYVMFDMDQVADWTLQLLQCLGFVH